MHNHSFTNIWRLASWWGWGNPSFMWYMLQLEWLNIKCFSSIVSHSLKEQEVLMCLSGFTLWMKFAELFHSQVLSGSVLVLNISVPDLPYTYITSICWCLGCNLNIYFAWAGTAGIFQICYGNAVIQRSASTTLFSTFLKLRNRERLCPFHVTKGKCVQSIYWVGVLVCTA